MEEKQWWTFTFGYGQQHEGMYVKIYGTYDSTRKIMFERYGEEWAFQYSEKEWQDWKHKGEWIDKGEYAECSNCGANGGTQFDGVEPIPLKTNFCHNCGAYMKCEVM